MKMNLSELEIRVLGSLMEKELTTPENYPLSLNALQSACNQKSNREPVMTLSEQDVQAGLQALGTRGLARLTTTGGRVAKYCHSIADKLRLDKPARALLAELMLRGPQTAGELRNRGERMVEFADLSAVEAVLGELQKAGPPLVTRLPRQLGHKEQRYAQLFAGMSELPELPEPPEPPELSEEASITAAVLARRPAGNARLERVETDLGSLREEIAALRQEVQELVGMFS